MYVNSRSLPVIVYHHVNNLGEDISEEQFEAQMHYLATDGFRSVFLKDWVRGKIKTNDKCIALTFDDGFLDNWVYAFPILKKYGLKATIFVSTSRPLDGLEIRLNLEDVWTGRCTKIDLPDIVPDWAANRKCVLNEKGSTDFFTWQEMRRMEASGHIDIQSHSHYHRDFFVSNQIVDFNRNTYFGVGWATNGDTRYGIPIYPRKSAMIARRYFDDLGLRDHLAQTVGGPEYFASISKRRYMKDLLKIVANYKELHTLRERFETVEEQRKRILWELKFSKSIIEDRLDKTCDLICWPWGEYSDLSIELARHAGYRGAVTFTPGPNFKGQGEEEIWRIRRFPPPRKLDDFARTLSAYSSPAMSLLLRYRTMINSAAAKTLSRLKDGQLLPAIRRRLFGVLNKQ